MTLARPEVERYSYRRTDLIAKIKVARGGRAAEHVVYGEITTGAESDIQNSRRSPAAWSAGGA